MKVWYIHGANASPLSFSFIKANIRPHDIEEIGYGHDVPLSKTVAELRRKAVLHDGPLAIVGHSLGGVIAAAVAQTADVERVVTLASPFGGSSAAALLQWFTRSQLMSDIAPSSSVLTSLRMNPPSVPMLSFVTAPGIDTLGEKGDGVVTTVSQTALIGPTYETVDLNHFEVLLSRDIAQRIDRFLWNSG